MRVFIIIIIQWNDAEKAVVWKHIYSRRQWIIIIVSGIRRQIFIWFHFLASIYKITVMIGLSN